MNLDLETSTVIEGGFDLYKSMPTPDCFAGRGVARPLVMMTDDCTAERSAIKASFTETIPWVATFHVLQAVVAMRS